MDASRLLRLAAGDGNLPEVRRLVEAGADANARDGNGRTSLYTATRSGRAKVVQYLVEKAGVDTRLRVNRFDQTLLHLAASEGHVEVVRYLTEKANLDANARDRNGWTPLHWAAACGHVAVVCCLVLEAGAHICARDARGWCPVHQATLNGHVKIVRYLVEEAGVDAGAQDGDDTTPLHLAAWGGYMGLVQYLVAQEVTAHARACVHMEDSTGRRPVDLAYQNGHPEIGKYLEQFMKAHPSIVPGSRTKAAR